MNLDELRDEIAGFDREIVDLIAKRVQTARRIGELKRDMRMPIRNIPVEEKVIKRFSAMAMERGLNQKAGEDLALLLIREAIEEQASLPKLQATRKKVMIIGGAGKMGVWLSDLLCSSGHDITIVDPLCQNGANIELAQDMDAVIVSAPISNIPDILHELNRICRDETLVFDIASLKSPFVRELKEFALGKKFCSVHPMFGPTARSMYDRNLLLCDCGNAEAVQEAMSLFDDHGARMTVIPIDEHDRYASYVLGMSHAINIAFFTALEKSGIPLEEFKRVASTTFLKHLDTAQSVASEDPRLYYEIQHLNQKSHDSWESFSSAVDLVMNASLDEDSHDFFVLMKKGKEFFRG